MSSGKAKSRKIALVGYRAVGKSSLAIRYAQNQFVDNYDPTIENTFHKTVTFRNQTYNLELVDTAGHDGCSPLPLGSFLNVDGWILVYSIATEKSFHYLLQIKQDITVESGLPNAPIVVVGNKLDLANERRVSTAEGNQFSSTYNLPFFEVSAKDNKGVTEMFERCLLEIEKSLGNVTEKNSSCSIS